MAESTLEIAKRIHDRVRHIVRNWGAVSKTEPRGTTIEDYLEREKVKLAVYRRCDPTEQGSEYIEVLRVSWRGERLQPRLLRVEYCEFGKPRKRLSMPLFGRDGFLYPVAKKSGYRGPRYQQVSIEDVKSK